MATVDGLDRVLRRTATFKKEISGKAETDRLLRVARSVQPLADSQAAATIGGDRAFSNWRRNNRIVADTEARVENPTTAVVRPKSKVRGLWRVMESGRKAYQAGAKRDAGVYTRKRTGERVMRQRRVKRATGAMRGWGAWGKAESAMSRVARPVHTREVVRDFRATFRGR